MMLRKQALSTQQCPFPSKIKNTSITLQITAVLGTWLLWMILRYLVTIYNAIRDPGLCLEQISLESLRCQNYHHSMSLQNRPQHQTVYAPSAPIPTISVTTKFSKPWSTVSTSITLSHLSSEMNPAMRSFSTVLLASLLAVQKAVAQSNTFFPGVIATGTMGITNPPVPTMGTSINQTSFARLLTVNSIDVRGSYFTCTTPHVNFFRTFASLRLPISPISLILRYLFKEHGSLQGL